MTEVTKAALVREFVELARNARTDGEKYDCQQFVRNKLIPCDVSREVRQVAVLHVLSSVASHFDGARYQIPETYDTIMARIPEKETGVRHAGRKLALHEGIIPAPGWGGK